MLKRKDIEIFTAIIVDEVGCSTILVIGLSKHCQRSLRLKIFILCRYTVEILNLATVQYKVPESYFILIFCFSSFHFSLFFNWEVSSRSPLTLPEVFDTSITRKLGTAHGSLYKYIRSSEFG